MAPDPVCPAPCLSLSGGKTLILKSECVPFPNL